MASLGRSSAMIGAGTLVSRVTGLIRSVMLVGVMGSSAATAADAFTTANALPQTIFAILSAGLLTAVFVPQIVKAARHEDGGSAFVSRLFTLATSVLVVVTAIATLAAPLLVRLFAAPNWGDDQLALATAFAYWCMPQLLFYGLFALVGESLNARKVFGPYTWAPIVNNLVSIAGFGAMIAMFATPMRDVVDWTPEKIAMLGATATGAVIAQFIVLALFWRRANLPLRLDFRWRGVGLGSTAKLAGWTFLMVIVGQIAGLVQMRIVNGASGEGASSTVWNYAWLVFMLPYSVIVLSIGTPYFTRVAEHAAANRHEELRADIDACIRTLGVFIVLATAAVAAAAVPAARIFSNSREDALHSAPVLLAFLVGLIPVAAIFIVQRTFYAYDDTRTPFYFTVLQGVIVVITAFLALWFVPLEWRTAAVALGQSVASTIQLVVASWLLRRRIGPLGFRSWGLAHVRFIIAAIPAALTGWGVYVLSGADRGWMVPDSPALINSVVAACGVLVIGGVAAIVYVLILALLRAPELKVGVDAVRRLVRR